jgi:hypothetical protein
MLPGSLTEYVDVYAGDLLNPLGPDVRSKVLTAISIGYSRGPWPRREQIQRLIEISQGLIDTDAAIGELLIRHAGGLAGALTRLTDPELRDDAVTQLSQLEGTDEMAKEVRAARDEGLLTDAEMREILSKPLARAPLPALIPVPAPLEPFPDDYPESSEEAAARDFFRGTAFSVEEQHVLVSLQAELDRGAITFSAWRARSRSIVRGSSIGPHGGKKDL